MKGRLAMLAFALVGSAPLSGSGQELSGTGQDVTTRAPETPHHLLRAVLETTLFISGNTVYYWWNKDFNAPDWELGWDKESWRKKLITFEGVRLDANQMSTNAGSHTEAGVIVYLIGRGNGLSAGSSLLLATGEVVAWEYLSEFREKVSINDLFTNSLGGLAVGEPFFQISDFFARGSDNGVNRTAALLFSPLSNLNGGPPRSSRVDELGLPADVWHQFDLYAGLANARWRDAERSETLLGLSSEINTVPGYGHNGTRRGPFGIGRVSQLALAFSFGEEGMTAALFATRVALAGYHMQRMAALEGRRGGSSATFSLVNSFEYTNRRAPGLPLDQIASFGVAGPTAELAHRSGDVQSRLRLEAIPNLAMVTSMAHPAYQEIHGTEGTKSVLAQRGYYFGYGLGVGGQLAVRYRPWELGFDSRWETYGSIEGVDRYQERVTNDFHLRDGRLHAGLWLSVRPLRGYGQITVVLDRASRSGTIGDLEASTDERRAALIFGLEL